MNRHVVGISVAVFVSLTGCGGGGGADEGSRLPSIDGRVADGYLRDARVCFDINGNKVCDTDEPVTLTSDGGRFSLSLPAEFNGDEHLVVVEVIPGVTVDEDTADATSSVNGATLDARYVLTAVRGRVSFISPLTTLVQSLVEANPDLSVDDAEAVLKDELGLGVDDSVSLFTDYIQNQSAGGETALLYARLHDVARVIASSYAENLGALEAAMDGSGVFPAQQVRVELIRVLNSEVRRRLPEIVREVAARDRASLNHKALAQATVGAIVRNPGDAVEIDQLLQSVILEKQSINVDTVSAVDAYTHGISHVTPFVGNVMPFDRYQLSSGDNVLQVDHYQFNASNGEIEQGSLPVASYVLGNNGWILRPTLDGMVAHSAEDNGQLVLSINQAGNRWRVSALGLALTGQSIVKVMNAYAGFPLDVTLQSGATFSEGAQALRVSSTFDDDFYRIEVTTECQRTLEWGGNCNVVDVNPNDALGTTPAQSLEELVVAQAWSAEQPNAPRAHFLGFDDSSQRALVVEFVDDGTLTSGTANFYIYDFRRRDADTQRQPIDWVNARPWTIETISGVSMLRYATPSQLRFMLADGEPLFFAVFQDFVRKVSVVPRGTVQIEPVWWFNDMALDDIKAAVLP